MARLFSSNDAIKATEAANNLIRRLYESLSWENTPRENVIAAKNTIATKKILGLLKDISVDELSNEKNGLKIKPIHDAGFHTYADLHQASLKIRVTDTFLERTFNLFNKLYFEEALSKVSLKIMPKGNCLGLFNPNDMSISIAEGEWKYQTYRNAMVHEMCHMFVHMTAGPSSAGAGDGHGKDWLEKANQLNADFPELNISLYADEHPD